MDDDERDTYYATVRVELEDVTAVEARKFWQALEQSTIESEGFEAAIVDVTPEL